MHKDTYSKVLQYPKLKTDHQNGKCFKTLIPFSIDGVQQTNSQSHLFTAPNQSPIPRLGLSCRTRSWIWSLVWVECHPNSCVLCRRLREITQRERGTRFCGYSPQPVSALVKHQFPLFPEEFESLLGDPILRGLSKSG